MFSVSSETLRDVRRVCALWVLIDSAPEPTGWNVVITCVDVPNVVVVHGMGLIEDLGSADNLARWEFLVVQVWVWFFWT